jgi:transposase
MSMLELRQVSKVYGRGAAEVHALAGDGDGPRRLVISSDFYSVYTSAGKKAEGLVNLYCWA